MSRKTLAPLKSFSTKPPVLSEYLVACSYMLNINLQNILILLVMLLQINTTALCNICLINTAP